MNQDTASYNEYYFAHCCGRPYQHDEEWLKFFGSIAAKIAIEICPTTVLDAGCAMGFLVEVMRQQGIEAWGVDISEYAIQKVNPATQQYCWVGSITEPFPSKYDLIVCIEVLEHLPPQEIAQAINNLCQHTDDILFSSTPFDYQEATHFNVKPPEYWAEQFAKKGFFRDVDFDASFITPWATRFRRNHEPMHRVLRAYERKFWLLWKENQDVRTSTVTQQNQLSAGEQLTQKLRQQVADSLSQLQSTQAELERSQAQLQSTQAELEQSQSTQAELERSQVQSQQTQVELEQSQVQLQVQLQQTQVELEQSQVQLQSTQAELEQSQVQLQSTQAELEQSQVQLQQTQAELEQSQVQLQSTQAELEQSQVQLQSTQAELEQSQVQLQQTQAELERSQVQLQSTQVELERSQVRLQSTQVELERSQVQLQSTQVELERSQVQLQQTQAGLERSQAVVGRMESSKFWKLRTVWFGLKQAAGLTDSSNSITASSDLTTPLSDLTILGINNIREVKFKIASKGCPSGFFDGVNGSMTTKIKVPSATPITARGWGIIADEGRPADGIIITSGKNNSLVAIAPVNLERPDVVKVLASNVYSKSGWSITFDPSSLPNGHIVLKAWAYNSAKKEAVLLDSTSFTPGDKNLIAQLKYRYAVLKVKGVRYALARLFKKLYYKLDNSQIAVDILPAVSPNDEPYQKWLSKNFPREADLRKMAGTVEVFYYKPVISVIMPVFNTPERILRQAIESVLQQVYPYWELCIADDASTQSYIKSVLEEYIAKDDRIKVIFRNENGHISLASNSALEIATGEFIALLDHDDLLTPDALYEVALLLNRHQEADMIYSDEDKVDEHNQLKDPFFKPDWCPDSFLSRMYTSHLGIYRRSLVTEIGGFREGYEGSQDYDLVLRLTEKTEKIFHIPKILYHWRIHSDSTASSSSNKGYATDAAQRAISDALNRRKESGIVIPVPGNHHIVRYEIKDFKLVSIIIPTKNLGSILDRCLQSIFEKTKYPNYEVLLIDNGSTEAETHDVINKWKTREDRFRCEVLDIPFNFSKINNYAVKQAKGDYLLFLNNDTEVITPDWLDAMVEQVQRPQIGAVGALLLYPDRTIQHAGVVSVGGVAGHSHKHYDYKSHGYFNQIQTINNYSAVTAACLMCRREVFETIEGFDENLTVAFNDIDLCFKMIEKGYRNISLPHVQLYHYESKSRGYEDTPKKQARFLKEIQYVQGKWKDLIEHDPCYSLNLTREYEDYRIQT